MNSFSTPDSTYSYGIARDVVDKFLEKYARVGLFFATAYGLTPKELRKKLIWLFQVRNNRWNMIRDTMKKMQNSYLFPEMLKLKDPLLMQMEIKLYKDFAYDIYIDGNSAQNAID